MKHARAIAIAILFLAAWASPSRGDARRPLVLLFETARGERADKDLIASTTRALRNYLRETQRVEAALFDRESPTVLRAIMEKKLTADKVASYSSQTERLAVAKELLFQYAAGAEVSVTDLKVSAVSNTILQVQPDKQPEPAPATAPKGKSKANSKPVPPPVDEANIRIVTQVRVHLWLAQVDGGKNSQWEATGTAAVGGDTPRDLDNAMQSAASSAVLEVARKGLSSLPRVSEVSPATGEESTAIGADQPPQVTKPGAMEYAAKGDESVREGDFAVAIDQYSQAVNADPGNGTLRVKLAEAYARKGMFAEADDELERASENGAARDILAAARQRIEKLRTPGQAPAQPDTREEPSATENRVTLTSSKGSRGQTTPAVAKIVEGDKLWNQGKPDEAADAYKESIKINPADWRAHERLALVDASMSLFGESRKVLAELSLVQPKPPATVTANRYATLRAYFDSYFKALLSQYDSAGADYEKHVITRESYYSVVKGLALRLESMAAFLDGLVVPPAKQPSHLRRSLACGLMAQASSSLLDYLETNKAKAKSSAATFAAQAKSELAAANKLDENKVIVERKAQPAPPPEPTPEPAPEPFTQPTPDNPDNYQPDYYEPAQ